MSLEDYTQTDRTDHERAKLHLAQLLNGRDYDDRLSASALAEHVPVAASTVRDLVKEIRRERGIAVYSKGSGYWHIQDPDELAEAIDAINDEIETRQETKQQLTRAFNRGKYE
jgi:glycosyltransferase involved in cell wall biosynthesis